MFLNYLIAALLSFPALSTNVFLTVTGSKHPNSAKEEGAPVTTMERTLQPGQKASGFNDLLAFVSSAPVQEDAGSCLYMSLTGVAEWWLAKKNPNMSVEPDGPLDLSERYFMNIGKTVKVDNWRTDRIYSFNKEHKAALNRDYPFTKNWYKKVGKKYRAASKDEPGASYGTKFNWVKMGYSGPKIRVPHFSRNIVSVPANTGRWEVGVMPEDIVSRVKKALKKNQAPVSVIYNHYGYWHAVYIAGYSDEISTQDCPFSRGFAENMLSREEKYLKRASLTSDQRKKERLLRKAKRVRAKADSVTSHFASKGCRETGVFYVRDSIYPDTNQPLYDYDPNQQGEEKHYSAKVVLREYEWLETLGNHVFQVIAH